MSTPLDIKWEAKVKHMKSNFDLIFCLLLSSQSNITLSNHPTVCVNCIRLLINIMTKTFKVQYKKSCHCSLENEYTWFQYYRYFTERHDISNGYFGWVSRKSNILTPPTRDNFRGCGDFSNETSFISKFSHILGFRWRHGDSVEKQQPCWSPKLLLRQPYSTLIKTKNKLFFSFFKINKRQK